MDKHPLGGSGLSVSRVLLGCGSIGGIGSPASTRGRGLSIEEGLAQIDTAVALGMNVLDTANSYAGGTSERTVGSWVADHPDADVLISTKVGSPVEPGQGGVDLSAPHIARQAEASVARLGRIDLYLSHAPDERTPIEETLTAFAALLEVGAVRAVGACNVSADELSLALDAAERLGLPRPEWVQNEYNLLAHAEEAELLRVVREHGLGYTPFSPLAGGILSGRYQRDSTPAPDSRLAIAPRAMHPIDDATWAGLDRLAAEADHRGVSMAALALAWVLNSPDVTAPLVAPRRPDQFAAVRDALALDLDGDERDRLAGFFAER